MDKEIVKRRIRSIRSGLSKKRISCLLVTKPANVTYITGFLGEDSWALLTKSRVYLLTDSRYVEQAQKECPACRIIDRAGPMSDAVAELVKKLKSVRTVTVEGSISVADFEQLKKTVKARFKTAEDIIETARAVKDDSEIAAIKAAVSISNRALRQTLEHIRPGISESELAGMLDFQILKLRGRNSFETIVAFGPNASRPHHQSGARRLKKRDTVLIDFGAKYKGYCSDITRCFTIGEPTAFYKRVFDTVEQAQTAAIKKIKPGVKLTEIDAAARQTIAETDLPVYGHGTGHGFGLEIHESPFLKAENDASPVSGASRPRSAGKMPATRGKLQAGQIITIEPGIYIPGKLGVRIEDDVLVTQTGHKTLTKSCPHSPRLPQA